MEAQNVPLTLENPVLWPVLCERILHKDAYCLHVQFQYGEGKAGLQQTKKQIEKKLPQAN